MRLTVLVGAVVLLSCSSSPKEMPATDAGTVTLDAGFPCGLTPMENPNNSDGECTFNSDCPLSQRCECESGVCACRTGPRGQGCAGVDACTDGNDCQSSLCAEGNNGYFCSGPCAIDDDCGGNLPLCRDIAFIGPMCIRRP